MLLVHFAPLCVAVEVFFASMRWIATAVARGEGVSAADIPWLVGSGVFSALGAIIYATKWPTHHARPFPVHESLHLRILARRLGYF